MELLHLNNTHCSEQTVEEEILYNKFIQEHDQETFLQLFKGIDGLLVGATYNPINVRVDYLRIWRYSKYKELQRKTKHGYTMNHLLNLCKYEFITGETGFLNHDYSSYFFNKESEVYYGIMHQFFSFLHEEDNHLKIQTIKQLWKREFHFIVVNVFQEYYFNFVMRCLRRHLKRINKLQSLNTINNRKNNDYDENSLEHDITPFYEDFDSNLNISNIVNIAKKNLSKKEFKLFQLKDLSGLTSGNISSILEIKVGAVDTTVSRYRKKLRMHLSAA